MSERVKAGRRAYNAPRRRQHAADTRSRILAAFRQLLREHGYPATSLTMVAQAAEVSVESVYAHFSTKRGLLSALVEAAVDPPAFDQQLAAALAVSRPQELLQVTAHFARVAYDQSWDIVDAMRGAGLADPEVAEAWRIADARARQGQAALIYALLARGALRDDLTTAELADVLWSMASPDPYRMLVVDRGWNGDRYERWLAEALAKLLLR